MVLANWLSDFLLGGVAKAFGVGWNEIWTWLWDAGIGAFLPWFIEFFTTVIMYFPKQALQHLGAPDHLPDAVLNACSVVLGVVDVFMVSATAVKAVAVVFAFESAIFAVKIVFYLFKVVKTVIITICEIFPFW